VVGERLGRFRACGHSGGYDPLLSIGGEAMSRRRDDTPETLMLALWLCFALAIGGWVLEVLAW
jgi:hypothetical protein